MKNLPEMLNARARVFWADQSGAAVAEYGMVLSLAALFMLMGDLLANRRP